MLNWWTALSDWDWKVQKMKDRAIGVFDSGVGGLTCAKELLKLVPNENMIYLGDTARMPYGVNTKETLVGYTNDDVDFLLSGKLFCGHCGKLMVGTSGTGKAGQTYYYYSCRQHGNKCLKTAERKEKLEQFVIDYITEEF